MDIDPENSPLVDLNGVSPSYVNDILCSLEYAKKNYLKSSLAGHSVSLPSNATADVMRSLLSQHLTSGSCLGNSASGCRSVIVGLVHGVALVDQSQFQILLLSSLVKSLSVRSMRRIFDTQNIPYEAHYNLSKFRRELRKFITRLQSGKTDEKKRAARLEAERETTRKRLKVHDSWPQVISSTLKNKVAQMFKDETSSSALSTFTCAACSSETYSVSGYELLLSDVDFDLFKKPLNAGNLPCQYSEGPLKDAFIDPQGVSSEENGDFLLSLCKTCHSALNRNKLPSLSLANGTYLGPVPPELQDLTPIEEAMIARCRSKCWIIQLKEETPLVSMPDTQRGIRGHIIIYPQQTSEIIQLLPPSVEDIVSPICVLFVGSTPPTTE